MGPHTDTHDHYALLILPPPRHRAPQDHEADAVPADLIVRYSRKPKGLAREIAMHALADDVREAFGPNYRLVAIIDDPLHEHPVVTTLRGRQVNDDRAHMP